MEFDIHRGSRIGTPAVNEGGLIMVYISPTRKDTVDCLMRSQTLGPHSSALSTLIGSSSSRFQRGIFSLPGDARDQNVRFEAKMSYFIAVFLSCSAAPALDIY